MASAPLSVTIPLHVAIEHGDDVLTELTLTEPDLGGLMELDKATGDMAQTLASICACTQLPPSVIKQLRMRDIKAIGEAAMSLVGEGQATGGRQRRGSLTSITGRLNQSNG